MSVVKKVLILSHSSEIVGGAERSMLDLFDFWTAKYNVIPHFIVRQPLAGLEKEIKKRGWAYSSIHYTNWSQRNPSARAEDVFRNARENAKAVKRIEAIIKNFKPDVVMTNTIVAPWAALAAHFQHIPHVWFVREYGDIDHKHTLALGREKTFEDISTLSELVVTNSQTLQKHVSRYIESDKITSLYTPFNLELLERKIKQSSNNPFKYPDSLKLVITGKIASSKGQDQAAEAVGELNKKGFNTELCVIGKPAEADGADSLMKAIEKYDIKDKVHLLGQQSNPLSIVRHADVGVMASQQEAFGRVTFEYMFTGKAVVGANSGATPELIKDGVNGYLYESGNKASLKSQLEKYIKNKNLILKHGRASKEIAIDMMAGKYSAEKIYKSIERVVINYDVKNKQTLNFSRRWLDYPLIAQKYIDESQVISFKRLLYIRIRGKLKSLYLFVTSGFKRQY